MAAICKNLRPSCGFCGKAEPPVRCAQCGLAQYCDAVCQKRHWKGGHRKKCRGREKPPPKTGARLGAVVGAAPSPGAVGAGVIFMNGCVVPAHLGDASAAPPVEPAAILEAACDSCGCDLNKTHKAYRNFQENCCQGLLCWPCLAPYQLETMASNESNGGPTNKCPLCEEPCSNMGRVDDYMEKVQRGCREGNPHYKLIYAKCSRDAGWHSKKHSNGWTKMCADAFKFTLEAAESGLLEAWELLGWHYLEGVGTPQNLKFALWAYEFAASRGLPDALTTLGKLHLSGWKCGLGGAGIAPNKKEALRYFERATLTDPEGMVCLASVLTDGFETTDVAMHRKGKVLMLRAAELEYEMAMRCYITSASENDNPSFGYDADDEPKARELAKKLIDTIKRRPPGPNDRATLGQTQLALAKLVGKQRERMTPAELDLDENLTEALITLTEAAAENGNAQALKMRDGYADHLNTPAARKQQREGWEDEAATESGLYASSLALSRAQSKLTKLLVSSVLKWERSLEQPVGGRDDPLLDALQVLEGDTAAMETSVDVVCDRLEASKRAERDCVEIEAGLGSVDGREDLDGAKTIVITRFGIRENEDCPRPSGGGPPTKWWGRLVVDEEGFVSPDADLVALLRVQMARREVLATMLRGRVGDPVGPPSNRAVWDPTDTTTFIAVDWMDELAAAGMFATYCAGGIAKRTGKDTTPEGRRLTAMPLAKRQRDCAILRAGIDYAKLWSAQPTFIQLAQALAGPVPAGWPAAFPVRDDARTQTARGFRKQAGGW